MTPSSSKGASCSHGVKCDTKFPCRDGIVKLQRKIKQKTHEDYKTRKAPKRERLSHPAAHGAALHLSDVADFLFGSGPEGRIEKERYNCNRLSQMYLIERVTVQQPELHA